MTTNVPNYYGVSFGNGSDGVSRLNPEFIVRTAHPFELARLAHIDTWKDGEGKTFAAANVEVDGDAEHYISSTLYEGPDGETVDGAAFEIVEVYPIEDITDHDSDLVYGSIYDAVTGTTFELASVEVWREAAAKAAGEARWEEETRNVVSSEYVAAIVNDDYSGVDDATERELRNMQDDLAADGWQISGAGDLSDEIKIMRPRPRWEQVEAINDHANGPVFQMEHNDETRAFFAKAEIDESATKFLPKFTLDDQFVMQPVFDLGDGPEGQIQRNLNYLMSQQIQEAVDKVRHFNDLAAVVKEKEQAQADKDLAAYDAVAPQLAEAHADQQPLTLAKVREELAAHGMTITKTDDELRVNFKGGSEETAYYAGNIDGEPDYADALATGRQMRLSQDVADAAAEFKAAKGLDDNSPDWKAAVGRRIAALDGYVAAVAAMDGKIELANKDGSQGAFVSNGTEADKPWRVTTYDDRGFIGHSDRATKVEAVREAIVSGFSELAPGKFKEFSQKPSFTEGEVAREEFHKRNADPRIAAGRAALAAHADRAGQTDAQKKGIHQ